MSVPLRLIAGLVVMTVMERILILITAITE